MSVPDFPFIDWSVASEDERRRVISRGRSQHAVDDGLREAMAAIVDDVADRGDAALIDALKTFDNVRVSGEGLRVSEAEFHEARACVSDSLLGAIRSSITQVRAFNDRIVERASWTAEPRPGLLLGEQASPIPSVGLFVPSGKGSFPSVLVQIATPAVVAGVPRIAVVVPPAPDAGGRVDPATLVVARELGLSEVYRSNGPAGIAALACGTATIPRVRKIVGPGSPAVACAQWEVQRFGCVAEVGFGPTDALIVADDGADPRLLAADLLNEAEHGPDSSAVLVATSRGVLDAVRAHLGEQLAALPEPRRSYAATSIDRNGGLVLAGGPEEAMAIADAYAPEHLQLAVSDPRKWLPLVRYAGTVLLGQWTTFAASNFVTGTPATLPTTGYAQVSSGVTADTYLVKSAVAQWDEAEFARLSPAISELAEHEGFPAHAATVSVRRG